MSSNYAEIGIIIRKFSNTPGIMRGWCQTCSDYTLPLYKGQVSGTEPVTPTDPSAEPNEHPNRLLMKGAIENNGRVIADGYGSDDNLLNLTFFGSEFKGNDPYVTHNGADWLMLQRRLAAHTVRNIGTIGNIQSDATEPHPDMTNPLADNGWFAQNHGLLALPAVYLSEIEQNPDSGAYVQIVRNVCIWGDEDDDANNDLVNSISFKPVASPLPPVQAAVYGALLAPDRPEVSASNSPMAIGWVPLGIWHMVGTNVNAAGAPVPADLNVTDLKVRYDHTQLPQLPAGAESVLRVLARPGNGGDWSVLSGQTVDTGTHRVAFTPLTIGNVFLSVASPGWVWKQSTGGSWTRSDAWEHAAPGACPDDTGNYSVCIDKGVTVNLTGTTGKVAMLLLGCTPNQTANQLNMPSGTGLQVNSLRLAAVDQESRGTLGLSGGTLTVDADALVAENGIGTVTQADGSCTVGRILHIGLYPGSVGMWDVQSGTLAAPRICIGTEGDGTLKVAGNSLSGVQDLTIRANLYAAGTLRGHGTIGTAGANPVLTMNGRVIADGGTLDLSAFATIRNNIDNVPPFDPSGQDQAPLNGWFAVNGGKLKLPPVNISGLRNDQDPDAGKHVQHTFVWGERVWAGKLALDTDHVASGPLLGPEGKYQEAYSIDLTNSVQVTFAREVAIPTPTGATMQIELLAPDRSEMPTNPLSNGSVRGFWHIQFYGLTPASGMVTLKFRYDDTDLVPADEQRLEVWQRLGSYSNSWTCVSPPTAARIDAIDHIIYATVPLSTAADQYFAVVLLSPDINQDGRVNVVDLLILADSFGKTRDQSGFDIRCDLNGDGVVDDLDRHILAEHFGEGVTSLGNEQQQQSQFSPGDMQMDAQSSAGATPTLPRPGPTDLQEWHGLTLYQALKKADMVEEFLECIAAHPDVLLDHPPMLEAYMEYLDEHPEAAP